MENRLKYQFVALVLVLGSVGLYVYQGYFLDRSDFFEFFGSYFLLFLFFYLLWLNKAQFSFLNFTGIAILFRLTLLFAVPALSNDFFRFIWDGELITQGINPYAHRPDDLISFPGFFDEPRMRMLYHGMGELSQQNFSCYPVLNQLLFFIPALLSDDLGTQLIVFKVMMILADVGIIAVARKIAKELQVSEHTLWLFALNPFIVLEFTGNLHFEGVMICLLLTGFYLVLKNQWLLAGIFFALSIHVKLIPLILMPVLIKKLGLRRMIGFSAVTLLTVLLLGKLFLNPEYLNNMLSSVDQYFNKFEFNAGVFYLIRELSLLTVGYDTIQTTGPVLAIVVAISIVLLAVFRKYANSSDLFKLALFSFLIYYSLASVVHPWYLSTLLIFSVFTPYRFPLIWSFLAMLSYSAYQVNGVEENAILLITEYALLFAVIIYELRKNNSPGLVAFQWDKIQTGS